MTQPLLTLLSSLHLLLFTSHTSPYTSLTPHLTSRHISTITTSIFTRCCWRQSYSEFTESTETTTEVEEGEGNSAKRTVSLNDQVWNAPYSCKETLLVIRYRFDQNRGMSLTNFESRISAGLYGGLVKSVMLL